MVEDRKNSELLSSNSYLCMSQWLCLNLNFFFTLFLTTWPYISKFATLFPIFLTSHICVFVSRSMTILKMILQLPYTSQCHYISKCIPTNKQKITLFLIVDFSLYVSVSIATASSDNKIMTSYLTIATSRQNCKFFYLKLWLSHNVSLYLSLRLYFISHFHISQCYYI